MWRPAFLLLPLVLASCGGRPETVEYFTKVTGVPLCSGASVRNVNADAPYRSPGLDSIYIVNITMPAECEPHFFDAVAKSIGASCVPSSGCSGISADGGFFGVEPLQNRFRITHST